MTEDLLWQHWTRPGGLGTKAVVVVYCEQHHEQMLAQRTITLCRRRGAVVLFVGGHAVRLPPSAARKRYCAVCDA